jgi:hypothetical protein
LNSSSTTPTVPCQVEGQAFYSSAQTVILDQIRPYRGYRSINIIQPRFNSSYHSLQVSGQHRFSESSQVNLAYTWAKNLTDNQTDRSTAPMDSYNIPLEYGRAALDRRHILTVNWIYEIPFFRGDRGFAGMVLGGWELQGIATYQTGLPFTPTTSNYDPAGVGFIPALVAGGRPDVICNPNANAPKTQQEWFDTSCFVPRPATNTTGVSNDLGDAGRGIIEGPSTKRVDLAISKNFRFSENMRLQLRAEAFNLFNWTNFNGLQTNVTSAAFGDVTSVRDPRTMQFGVKFYW